MAEKKMALTRNNMDAMQKVVEKFKKKLAEANAKLRNQGKLLSAREEQVRGLALPMRYKTDDLVLPLLASCGDIPAPCPVSIELSEAKVRLVIGPRDWDWNRSTGKMIGSGTGLCKPVADDSAPTTAPTISEDPSEEDGVEKPTH